MYSERLTKVCELEAKEKWIACTSFNETHDMQGYIGVLTKYVWQQIFKNRRSHHATKILIHRAQN